MMLLHIDADRRCGENPEVFVEVKIHDQSRQVAIKHKMKVQSTRCTYVWLGVKHRNSDSVATYLMSALD